MSNSGVDEQPVRLAKQRSAAAAKAIRCERISGLRSQMNSEPRSCFFCHCPCDADPTAAAISALEDRPDLARLWDIAVAVSGRGMPSPTPSPTATTTPASTPEGWPTQADQARGHHRDHTRRGSHDGRAKCADKDLRSTRHQDPIGSRPALHDGSRARRSAVHPHIRAPAAHHHSHSKRPCGHAVQTAPAAGPVPRGPTSALVVGYNFGYPVIRWISLYNGRSAE